MGTDFQAHSRHEAGIFAEFRKLLSARPLESVDFDATLNVMPLPLLLTYLVHQLPPEVPSLPTFSGVTPSAFLKDTLLPLWDANEAGLTAFKSSVAKLSDKHELDPTESPIVAFIVAQSA